MWYALLEHNMADLSSAYYGPNILFKQHLFLHTFVMTPIQYKTTFWTFQDWIRFHLLTFPLVLLQYVSNLVLFCISVLAKLFFQVMFEYTFFRGSRKSLPLTPNASVLFFHASNQTGYLNFSCHFCLNLFAYSGLFISELLFLNGFKWQIQDIFFRFPETDMNLALIFWRLL